MRHWMFLTLAAVMLVGLLVGCSPRTPSAAAIEYRRSGGFAGLDDHLTINPDGTSTLTRGNKRYEFLLDSSSLSSLQQQFEQAAFTNLRAQYLPANQGNDLFGYTLTYKGHTVRTMDGAVPPALQPILETLNQVVEREGNL